jgi:transposase
MADSKRAPRRRHPEELKARVLSACAQPGASVAAVAQAHGLNANLVHKWRRRGTPSGSTVVTLRETAGFIPLALPASPGPAGGDIRIDLRRGPIAVNVIWPVASAAHCAAWLRALLK